MKAYVFDLDNTLIDTYSCVIASYMENGEYITRRIPSKEYNARESWIGCDLDFSEFNDINALIGETKLPVFYLFWGLANSHNKDNVFICTSRENVKMIHQWLEKFNVCIPITNIFTMDPLIHNNTAQLKADTIKFLAKRYDEILVWEDEERFIKAMQEAADKYDSCQIRFADVNAINDFI